MSLSSLRLPQETVEVPGAGEFAVRGLSLADCTLLARNHGAVLTVLFDRFMSEVSDLTPESVATIGYTLLEVAPDAACEIIALASGEPKAIAVAAALPFPVQIDALEKIALLTFTSEASVKKLFETVVRASRAAMTTVTSLRA